MNLAYAAAFLSSGCYGLADLLGGLAARRGPAMQVAMLSAVAAIVVMALAVPFVAGAPTRTDLLWGLATGVASTAGSALIFHALALGPMSVASPVLCVVGLSLPVVVGVATGERPSPLAWAGVALAVLAIPALSVPARHETAPSLAHVRRTVLVAILAGLAAGCFLTFISRIGPRAGLLPLIEARVVAIVLFTAAFALLRQPLLPPPSARALGGGAGALDATANVAYWFASQSVPLSLAAPLVSLAPAVTVLLARIFLGERWSGWQKFGLLLALAAGACITVG